MATEAELRDALIEWFDYAHRLKAALEFYADPKHWESVCVEDHGDGLQTWESGAAVDGGARARAALIDGSEAPDQCVDYGHHGREHCVVCGLPNPAHSDGGGADG